jgi:long-chain acyl-CoA synthetase
VAPEKIENVVIQSLLVGQAFIYGDSLQSALVAIIVPDEDPVRNMLATSDETALAKAPFADICKSEKLKSLIMHDIKRLGKHCGLLGFEIPKALHLDSEAFSVENGLLTPTFKLKRQQARDKYEKQIEDMYVAMPKLKSNL